MKNLLKLIVTLLIVFGWIDSVFYNLFARFQFAEQISPTTEPVFGAERTRHAERIYLNREIEVTNKSLRQLKSRISKLQNWLKEEANNIMDMAVLDENLSIRNMSFVILNKILFIKRRQIPIFGYNQLKYCGSFCLSIYTFCRIKFNIGKIIVL